MDGQRLKSFVGGLGGLVAIRLSQIEAIAKNDKKALAALLGREADLAKDDAEREWLRFSAGELFVECDDKQAALEQFGQISKCLEWKRLGFLVLEENARVENDLPRVAELYRERAAISEPEKAQALALLRARLLAFAVGDRAEAGKALDELAEQNPESIPVLLTRVQFFLEGGDWKKLAEVYKALFELGEKGKDKLVFASCAFRIAALMEGRIGSPLAALEWYGKLFDQPDAAAALPSAIQILESLKQVKELKSALEKFSALVPDDEQWLKSLLLFKQSQICEIEGDKDSELKLLRKTVELDPGNLLALFRVEAVARSTRDYQLLAWCLERICPAISDGELKYNYALELAQVYLELLNDPDKAGQALALAEKVQPGSLAVLRLKQALAFKRRDWKALAEVLAEEIKLTEDPKELQSLLIKRAEIMLYGAGDLDQAAEGYRQALEIAPSQFPLLRGLEQILLNAGDFEAYLRILQIMEKLITPAENRIFYAARKALVAELFLGKAELAVQPLSDLIKLRPESIAAWTAMAKILRTKRAADNYVKATERILALTVDLPEHPFFLYQAAWDFENIFNQAEKAQELWQKFCACKPAMPALLFEQRRTCYKNRDWARLDEILSAITLKIKNPKLATAFLLRTAFLAETFLGEPGKARASYEKALQQGSASLIYPALIELAYFQSDWESASALFKDFGQKLSKPFQAACVWQSAMMLWDKSKSPAERILEELKQSEETGAGWLAKTSRMEFQRRQNDYQGLSESLEEAVSLLEENKLLPVQLEYAWLLSRRLDRSDQAIEQYLKIVSQNAAYLPAVRELTRIALLTSHARLLVQALAREIPARIDPEVLIFIYHWLALTYEEDLKDNERAVSSLRAAVKIKPDWVPALSELRRLYGKLKAYKELVNVISSEAAVTPELERKLALFREQAAVYEQNLREPLSAVAALNAAAALSPENLEIIGDLNRLYLQLQKWPELAGTIEQEIKLTREPGKKAELQIQIAQLYDEKLGDIEKSVANYEFAEKALPDYMPVLRALERLYPRLSRFRELVRVLDKIAALVPDRQEKAELINRIGKTYREKLKELDSAISSHLRVLEIAPEDQPALESLVELYREKQDKPNLVKGLQRLAEVLARPKPEAARALYMEAGVLYEKELKNDDNAISCYRKASALAPNELGPVRAERALFERRQDWKEVVRLLENEARIVPSPEEKKATLARIGNICETSLSDAELAAKYYQAGLKLDPEYLPAVKPLAEILQKRQAWQQAEPLYQIWVKALNQEKPERQAEILHHFGVVEEKLNKTDKAIECFSAAAQRKARYLEPLSRLYDIYLNRGEKQKAVTAGREYLTALEPTGDQKQMFAVLSRMGTLAKELGDAVSAIEYLERGLAIDQSHYPSLRLLADLYVARKDWTRALSTFDRLVRAAGAPDLVSRGLLEKGEILDRELGQRESAIAHFRKAVEIKPDYLPGWRALASVLTTEKRWPDAAAAMQKIIELEPNLKNKVEDIHGLGIIYRDGFADLNRAKECFEKALGLDKMHVPSMEAILSIYFRQKQWDKYIELSARFIGLIPKAEEKRAAPLHYQRGQVLRDFLNDRQKAVAEFTAAIRLDPDLVPARVELAELYAKDTSTYPLAVREHQEVVSREIFRLPSFRQMGMIYELMGKLDEAYCSYKILELHKNTNRDETMFIDAHDPQAARNSNKTLTDDLQYRLLAHPDCRGPLFELIAELGDYLAEVLPPGLEKTGANRSNKVPVNSPTAFRKMTDELALNLGAGPYELYLVPQMGEPKVAATEPPSLVVNADWMNHLREAERRFILAKYMAHLKLRHGVIFNHPLPEVFRAAMLFVWLVVPEVKVPGVAEDDLERLAKPIKRAVPRKVRAALEEKAKSLAHEGLPKDPAGWLRGVRMTGHFAGMLLTNDLMESLSAALKMDSRLKNVNLKDLADPKSVLEQSEDLKELLRFWVSEAHFTLRKRSGFSLLST